MPHEVFSPEWAKAWGEELNNNDVYRQAARNWKWPLVLVMAEEATEPTRQVYLDLWQGTCREARLATNDDIDKVPYVIEGERTNWLAILKGELDPIMALMRSKLKLSKGNLFALARYGSAAKELVKSAANVDALLPGSAPVAENGAAVVATPVNGKEKVFATTSLQGLRHDLLPMKLYQKAKRLGIWNPSDISFEKDISDWQGLNDLEKEVLLHLTSLFQAGEESVTLDLLPLMMAVAKEGRIEEEMYLSTFLWEEAKHTEFFRRFLDEVAEDCSDLSRFHSSAYRRIFYEELPTAMNALLADASPAAQIRASATYNMVVEGTLAETGYHAYYEMLQRNNLLPGLREGIGLLKRDESRHIAYGIYLLSRLIAQDTSLWRVLEKRMADLLELALETINQIFEPYEVLPFGLKPEDFIGYAMDQFDKRMKRIEQAVSKPFDEIEFEA